MALKTEITTTQTTEVQLRPLLKRQLLTKLKTFQTNHAQLKTLNAAQDAIKDEIDLLFAKAGEANTLQAGVKLNGFSVKRHVGETTTKLDKAKLCKEAGITLAQIDAASKTSPKKAYTKIVTPNEKEDE